MVKTYSNGRMMVDWFNHLDRNYQILNYDVMFTPFLNFGFGTGTVDRQVMPRPYELARPYETLGLIGNGEVGGAFTFKKYYRLEGSAYGLSPVGPQKVYSRIVAPDDRHAGWRWAPQPFLGSVSSRRAGSMSTPMARGRRGLPVTMAMACILGQQQTFKNFTSSSAIRGASTTIMVTAFIMLRYNFTGILRNLTTGE